MGAYHHLSDDQIQAIHAAAVATDLAAQQDALLAGLPPTYTATLTQSGPPAARLLQTLHALNAVSALADGTVPLAVWLRNAATLASAYAEGRLFEDALNAQQSATEEPAWAAARAQATGGALASDATGMALTSTPLGRPTRVFVSYARVDAEYRRALAAHLATLRTQGLISDWHDGEVAPGEEWDAKIRQQLSAADIIVLLISADFFASEYINCVEIPHALERYAAGSAVIIPIVVRAVEWKHTPLARIQGLPENGKAVKSWADQDEAWADVAAGIRRAVESLAAAATSGSSSQTNSKASFGVRDQREAESSSLTIYRERVRPLFDYWETGLVGLVFERSGVSLSEFDKMYVPRRLLDRAETDKSLSKERGATLDAPQILELKRHLLVRGSAGAGKSIWLASCFRQLQRNLSAIPLLIVGKEVSRDWRDAKGSERSIDSLLCQRIAEHVGDDQVALAVLRACKAPGGARPVILFDGWDEVGPHAEELGHKLFGFLRQYPHVRAIVTSRPFGVRQPQEGFDTMELQPFNEREIEALCCGYFGQRRGHGSDEGRSFFSRLSRSRRTLDMARTPLMLTMMLIVGERRALPEERHELYSLCIEELVGYKPEARARAGAVEAVLHWRPDDFRERIRVLQRLAFSLQQKQFSSTTNIYGEPMCYTGPEELAKMLPQEWPNECPPGMTPEGLRRGFVEWLAGPAGLLIDDWGGLRFVHLSLQEYLAACELNSALTEEANVSEMFISAVANVRWWETMQLWSALLSQHRPEALDKGIDALFEVNDMGRAVALAGTLMASGRGSATRFDRLLKLFPDLIAIDWSDGTELCAAAFKASADEARRRSLAMAICRSALRCPLPGWLRLHQFASLAGLQSIGSWPPAESIGALCLQAMNASAIPRETIYGAGRILTGGAPLWPGAPSELAWLQLWPSRRRVVGLRLQLALVCGASRENIQHIAPGLLDAVTWRDVEQAHIRALVAFFSRHEPLVKANQRAVREAKEFVKSLRRWLPDNPGNMLGALARFHHEDLERTNAREQAEPLARNWLRDLSRGLSLRNAALVPARVIETPSNDKDKGKDKEKDKQKEWEGNLALGREMSRKSYSQMVRAISEVTAMEQLPDEARAWFTSLVRRRPERPSGDLIQEHLAAMHLEWQRPGVPGLAFSLLQEWRLNDRQVEGWLLEMAWLDTYSVGFDTARAYAAGLDAGQLNAQGQLLVETCRLSLNPEAAPDRFEAALAAYGIEDDPLWPALARHLVRRSSNADRILLADLATHFERRKGPLSDGLRYLVRGDLVLEGGEVLTLDDLSNSLGLDRLPLLDEMEEEVDVRFNDDPLSMIVGEG